MTAAVEWAAAAVSLLGAGLAYVGARRGSRPDRDAVVESRRDEWGRRFSQAIELMGASTSSQRAIGRALFGALLESNLADADDVGLGEALLRAGVIDPLPSQLRSPGAGTVVKDVDEVQFVEDDGSSSRRTEDS